MDKKFKTFRLGTNVNADSTHSAGDCMLCNNYAASGLKSGLFFRRKFSAYVVKKNSTMLFGFRIIFLQKIFAEKISA